MWSAVPLIVLVQVYLLGAMLQAVPVEERSRSYRTVLQARRPDYTYTVGVGAHKFIAQHADWNTARRTCEQDGAHLVIINSVAEAEAVVRLLNSTNTWSSHVGVHDLYQEGEFVTILDEALIRTGFTAWAEGEPNNSGFVENCVELQSSGKFNDISCVNYRIQFVCELPHAYQCVYQDPLHLQSSPALA